MTETRAAELPWTYRPVTLDAGVRAAFNRTPDKLALRETDRTLTYRALVSRINRVGSAAMGDLNLGLGDRAAILAGNCLEYIEIMCGLSGIGIAVATPSPRLTAAEVKLICDDCGARVLFVERALEDMVRAIPFGTVKRIIVIGGDYEEWLAKGRDTPPDIPVDEWFELRTVEAGEGCPKCDGTLEVFKGMEIGHIFKLGTKYSESMGATVLNQDGKPVPIVMGSYGIGVERIITAAVEQNHDDDGIVWPSSLTPFDVVVTITNMKQDELRDAGEKLYHELQQAGLEVLLDDRDERAGVKFKDADLIGIPHRVTIGKKIADGVVELFDRHTKKSEDVKITDVVAALKRD